MSKTKFTKVAVSERLPEKESKYLIINVFEVFEIVPFRNGEFLSWQPSKFWLEESPDREEEMIEMLEKVYPLLFERHLYNTADDIKKLLQSLKQEK